MPNPKQQAGYRDRVRQIVEKDTDPGRIEDVAGSNAYPADLALLRLAGVQIEQRNYRDASKTAREFLDRFPTIRKKPGPRCS